MTNDGSPDKSMGQLSLAWKAIHIGLPMLVTGGNALGKEGQADNSLEGFTLHSSRPTCGCPHG